MAWQDDAKFDATISAPSVLPEILHDVPRAGRKRALRVQTRLHTLWLVWLGSARGVCSRGALVKGQKRPKTKIFYLFLRFEASGAGPGVPGGSILKFRAAD